MATTQLLSGQADWILQTNAFQKDAAGRVVALEACCTDITQRRLAAAEKRRLELELQQARRFEKNFLLYGTNLPEAREHAQAALDLMTTHVDRFLADATVVLARDRAVGPGLGQGLLDHTPRWCQRRAVA